MEVLFAGAVGRGQAERCPWLWCPLAKEEGGTYGVSRKRAPEVIQGLEILPGQPGRGSPVYLLSVLYFNIMY